MLIEKCKLAKASEVLKKITAKVFNAKFIKVLFFDKMSWAKILKALEKSEAVIEDNKLKNARMHCGFFAFENGEYLMRLQLSEP